MLYRLAADATLFLHLAFIAFAVFGGLLTVWHRRAIFLHLPAALWGAIVEFTGSGCPLTDLENLFRAKAGLAGYNESFVEHYLLAIIYPAGLTQEIQLLLGGIVVTVNAAIYLWVYCRLRGKPRSDS